MKSFILVIMLLGSSAFASNGLTIHALEMGVGKFHRYDNKVHTYSSDNAWKDYILPDSAPAASATPLVQKNADGSYTIFYSALDTMMNAVVDIAKQENKSVSVLNIHGHGLPGGMWFPKDVDTLNSSDCADWRAAANGDDTANYNQYYSEVSVDEIQQIQQMSNFSDPAAFMSCITGLAQWQEVAAKIPAFKATFANDAQIHFLSCVVGMGTAGEAFTNGIAQLLLPAGGHVATSMDFGLGDWSMPEGMGFWDYQSDAQVAHDNSVYTVNKRDREIMQKGTVRISTQEKGVWKSNLLPNQDFLKLGFTSYAGAVPATAADNFGAESYQTPMTLPASVRIPGTTQYIQIHQ